LLFVFYSGIYILHKQSYNCRKQMYKKFSLGYLLRTLSKLFLNNTYSETDNINLLISPPLFNNKLDKLEF